MGRIHTAGCLLALNGVLVMPNATWIGGTSTAYATDTNWSPVAVPATGVVLYYTDQAQQGMAGDDAAGKTHDIIMDPGFIYAIGSSGVPFHPDAIGTLMYAANSILPSYFTTDVGDIDRVVVDSQSTRDDLVNLNGTIVRIIVRRGKVLLDGASTVNGRVSVEDGELTIPSGVTVAGLELSQNGGTISDSAGVPTVVKSGGEYVLDGTAGIGTYLEMHDGTFWWDASGSSTIALAELFGGAFKLRKDRAGRTLTAAHMYGNAVMDLRAGGHSITYTAPIRAYGNNQPMFPKGASYTVGV